MTGRNAEDKDPRSTPERPEGAAPESSSPQEPEAGAARGDLAEFRVELEQLRAELEDLQKQYDDLYDRYLRTNADFDNYKKRIAKDRAEDAARAQAELLSQILDPLDDLSRALAVDASAPEARSVIEGFRLVQQKLTAALERAGLEVISVEGTPFDPELHDAVLTVPAEEPEEHGQVAQELSRGYRFLDRMLRPARVQVKKYGPSEPESP